MAEDDASECFMEFYITASYAERKASQILGHSSFLTFQSCARRGATTCALNHVGLRYLVQTVGGKGMTRGESWHLLLQPMGVSAEATLVRVSASQPVVSARDIDAEVEQEETE
jgi:hypothetical protein